MAALLIKGTPMTYETVPPSSLSVSVPLSEEIDHVLHHVLPVEVFLQEDVKAKLISIVSLQSQNKTETHGELPLISNLSSNREGWPPFRGPDYRPHPSHATGCNRVSGLI